MTEKLTLLQTTFDECQSAINRNQALLLNNQSLETPTLLYKSVSSIIEITFTNYFFDFFISQDFFQLLFKIDQLYSKTDKEVKVRLLAMVQLMISNLRSSEHLNKTIELNGFPLFFDLDFGFDSNEETADYFINIAKSMILKADQFTNANCLKNVLKNVLVLNSHRDNLVKTTVRNIILTIVRIDNDTFVDFVHSHPFRCFIFDILRDVGAKIEITDSLIVNEKIKELQDAIYSIQENLQFIDELSNFTINLRNRVFVINSFTLLILVHLLVPTFRADLKIRNGKIFGINTVLFLLNTVLLELKNNQINKNVVLNILLSDNLNKLPEELLNFELLHREKYAKFEQENLFQKIENFEFFKDNFLTNENSGKIESGLLPAKNNKPKTELSQILFSKCTGKIFQTLLAFFRSKDDNMILLTTNVLLFVFVNYKLVFDINVEKITEKMFELLELDPSFRLVTCENLSKLITFIEKHQKVSIDENFSRKAFQLFNWKITNLKKLLKNPHFLDLIINKFKKVAQIYDSQALLKNPTVLFLNWLALFNYNFSSLTSKDLRYLDLSYKLELTEEEFVEVEIKMFFLFKNLRYSLCTESIFLEKDQNVSNIYQESFAQVNNPSFAENATLIINFQTEPLLLRLFSANCVELQKSKIYLATFGRDLMLVEEVDKDKMLYRIIFREYYTNVIVYVHRSNQRQLNVSLKNKIQFWSLVFCSVQLSLQSKNLVDDVYNNFKKEEGRFVETVLGKFELDLVNNK